MNENFIQNSKVVLNPKGREELSYGVTVKYYEANEKIISKRIDYVATVNFTKKAEGILIGINKQKVYFNQHEPDLISEIISNAITKAIYPLQTMVDSSGVLIKGIINHSQIGDRWEKNKKQITEKFTGEVIDKFINKTSQKIKNQNLLEKSMNYDMFWNLFFHPKLINNSQSTDLYLAIIPYKGPMKFVGVQKINNEVTDYNSVIINFNSQEMKVPESLMPNKTNALRQCFMKLDVVFDLDSQSYVPMHTMANFELFYKNSSGDRDLIKKIQFSMYQLSSSKNILEFDVTEEDEKKAISKKRKGGFKKFLEDLLGG